MASGKPKKTANSREVEKQGTAEKHRGKEAEKIRKAEKQRSGKVKKKAEKQMKQKSKRNNGEKIPDKKINTSKENGAACAQQFHAFHVCYALCLVTCDVYHLGARDC